MAYIGKSPSGTGVRQRYHFTATGGETSLAGTDDNGLTLSYTDGAYVDVLLNGIELVAGTDYNTSTANTIAGLAALAASDVVTVTVYDIFTVADTVSAKDGGTFSGNVVFNGNTTGLDLNGTEMVLDADGDTSITADTDDQIDFKTGGSDRVTIDASGNVGIGTTSPAQKLHVSSSTAITGLLESTGSSASRLYFDNTGMTTAGDTQIWSQNNDLAFNTSGAEAMRINSSGYVTKPKNPCWALALNSNFNPAASGTYELDFDRTNVDNTFLQNVTEASGQITVPVAGKYAVNFNLRLDGVGAGYVIGYITKNGGIGNANVSYTIIGSPSATYETVQGSDVYDLDAGDFVSVKLSVSSDTSWTVLSLSRFSGYLIG